MGVELLVNKLLDGLHEFFVFCGINHCIAPGCKYEKLVSACLLTGDIYYTIDSWQSSK